MRVCLYVCWLHMWSSLCQFSSSDFLNCSMLPESALTNKMEVHAKMLWVSIQNFSSWMQIPQHFQARLSLHFISSACSLTRGTILAEGNLTFHSFPSFLRSLFYFVSVFREDNAGLADLKTQLCGERSPAQWRNWMYIRSSEHLLGSLNSTFKIWPKPRKAQKAFCYCPLVSQ